MNVVRINAITTKNVRYDVGTMQKSRYKPYDRHVASKADIADALANRIITKIN